MKSNIKFFKNLKSLSVDKFFHNVLYDKKIGYYNNRQPFGKRGDFITSPKISALFSEIIAIWLVSTWENFGKPKNINIIELGPGDGSLTNILLKIFKNFPEFNKAKNVYLLEISDLLKKKQKININGDKVKWIKNLKDIKKGPVIFFGNEYFDAIPIKQFKRQNGYLYEKYFYYKKNSNIYQTFRKAKKVDREKIKLFKTLNNLKFIEYPKLGLKELKKIMIKISKLKGCLLLIDYGYTKSNNKNTLQSVMKHKKNNILKNLGKADITSHVNFELLKEFFLHNNLKVKNIITQKEFLETMGILTRADILSRKMKFSEKADLYLRLKRLLSPISMGNMFKVILAYNNKNQNYFGFK
tara:strand:+ start:638 stop:1702 length:1065 start_codon:yes stop_codon:yes gene_type:complete